MKAEQLSIAITIATQAHLNQIDESGVPYILHPLWVMNKLLKEHPKNWHLGALGVMHDVLEDCPDVTADILRSEGFSNAFVEELNLLTHKDESYDEYIDRISICRNAALVKMADLEHNSKIFRMKGLRDKDFARLQKYHKAYDKLRRAIGEI